MKAVEFLKKSVAEKNLEDFTHALRRFESYLAPDQPTTKVAPMALLMERALPVVLMSMPTLEERLEFCKNTLGLALNKHDPKTTISHELEKFVAVLNSALMIDAKLAPDLCDAISLVDPELLPNLGLARVLGANVNVNWPEEQETLVRLMQHHLPDNQEEAYSRLGARAAQVGNGPILRALGDMGRLSQPLALYGLCYKILASQGYLSYLIEQGNLTMDVFLETAVVPQKKRQEVMGYGIVLQKLDGVVECFVNEPPQEFSLHGLNAWLHSFETLLTVLPPERRAFSPKFDTVMNNIKKATKPDTGQAFGAYVDQVMLNRSLAMEIDQAPPAQKHKI